MLSLAERFMKEDALPNLQRLAAEGSYAESLPSIPVDTPTNWTTIATGAEPATHGIQSFTAHQAGEPFELGEGQGNRNKQATSSRAEFLWTAAERQGKRAAVINYPTGWPALGDQQVVLGGMTPGGDLWRVRKPCAYSTGYPETIALDLPLTQIKHSPLAIRPARGWRGEVRSVLSPLEAEIRVGLDGLGEDLFLLFLASGGGGYDRLVVSASRDREAALAELGRDEWTPWLLRELGGTGVAYRLKLAHLSPDAKRVELYCTDVFRTEGWSHPADLAAEIVAKVGPYVEGLECPYVPIEDEMRPYGPLNVAWRLALEQADFQATWMADAAGYLQDSRGWDVLFLHYHLLDTLNHTFLGYLDPEFPYTTPGRTADTWELYRAAYATVDRLIGRLKERCVDGSTTLVITSDHAALPCWRYVSVVRALADAGLLEYAWDPASGKFRVDVSRSRAIPYLDPQHIWVNLAGREPDGLVPPERYEAVRDQVIAALRQIRDPETGGYPIRLVCRPEDLGLIGRSQSWVGDVVYFLEPGYSTWDGELDSLRFGSLRPKRFTGGVVGPSPDVVGHHTPYLPAARYKDFTNRATTFFYGPGIRPGYRRPWPIRLKDISPTMAYLLGIDGPAQAEGSILWDFIEGARGDERR